MSDEVIEILLVEDNPNDLELTLHAFAEHKLANRIRVARDGQEALELLFGTGAPADGEHRLIPRVILLDLKLPKVDGLEVLRAVRGDPALHGVPVVILTSSREERDIVESYDLGVNSYIVKPIDFEKFAETVRTLGFYWLLLNEPPGISAGAAPEVGSP
jgi:two-component system response regulator